VTTRSLFWILRRHVDLWHLSIPLTVRASAMTSWYMKVSKNLMCLREAGKEQERGWAGCCVLFTTPVVIPIYARRSKVSKDIIEGLGTCRIFVYQRWIGRAQWNVSDRKAQNLWTMKKKISAKYKLILPYSSKEYISPYASWHIVAWGSASFEPKIAVKCEGEEPHEKKI